EILHQYQSTHHNNNTYQYHGVKI
ncbi:transposase, partial [Shigella flexneri]|nr:transposase [Shigella flexneri]EFX9989755.1 transposase [Shigella flexneri]EFY0280600.1 transposase [Shigella flexneri]EFY0425507.1 transposase [Shigella flexneri]EFY0465032.1 transposase [Shigella flexneri]